MMTKRNNLAIVIPAYKATFLAAALDSIAAQTCQDFTLYIGDDCSPNNLGEIVDRYRDKINLVYRRFDTNMGGKDLVAQWERCIDMSQGEEWIWLFSDDDVMEKNCVEEFYKTLLLTNESYDLYHFNVKVINDDNQIIRYPMAYPQNLDSYSYYKGKLQGRYISLVVENIFSRKVYEKYRGFKKFDLAWGSDTATWVLYSERKGFYTIDNAYVLWRCGSQNISPNMTSPIAERKVKALVAFFNWSYQYFLQNKQHVLFTNIRAFVSRMAQFSTFVPQEVCRMAIVYFCSSHGSKAFVPILSFLIKIKGKND